MPLASGTRLGPYEIVGAIGAGGMGEVYRARDTKLDREIALKVLPFGALTDATARTRLVREARLAASLNHPSICTVHDVDESGGAIYIAMELVAGLAPGRYDSQRRRRFRSDRSLRPADRGSTGLRARARHRPSRSEGRKRARHARRPRQSAGLRPGRASDGQRLFYFAPGDTTMQERAFVEIERALAIDPDLDTAHLARGLDEAKREVDEALRLNPATTLADFRRGVVALYEARYKDALDVFNATPPGFQPFLVAFQAADSLFHLGRKDEAPMRATTRGWTRSSKPRRNAALDRIRGERVFKDFLAAQRTIWETFRKLVSG